MYIIHVPPCLVSSIAAIGVNFVYYKLRSCTFSACTFSASTRRPREPAAGMSNNHLNTPPPLGTQQLWHARSLHRTALRDIRNPGLGMQDSGWGGGHDEPWLRPEPPLGCCTHGLRWPQAQRRRLPISCAVEEQWVHVVGEDARRRTRHGCRKATRCRKQLLLLCRRCWIRS